MPSKEIFFLTVDCAVSEYGGNEMKVDKSPVPVKLSTACEIGIYDWLICDWILYYLQLELKYAAETNSLVPPHQYVPWVVVDGQPLYEDYENFISYICKAYKGNVMPEACSNLSLIPNHYGVNQAPVFPASCNKEITTLPTRIKSAITMWIRKMSMVASL